jgi:hypothetical protein
VDGGGGGIEKVGKGEALEGSEVEFGEWNTPPSLPGEKKERKIQCPQTNNKKPEKKQIKKNKKRRNGNKKR